MNSQDVLDARPHWWAAFQAYDQVQEHPATGGRILPLSSPEPLDDKGLHMGTMTPIFETKEAAGQWIAAFREGHPDTVDLWDKYGPVMMSPKQLRDAFIGIHKLREPYPTEHIVPIPIVHEVLLEFFKRYSEGMKKDPVRGHADAQNFAMRHRHLQPNPELI